MHTYFLRPADIGAEVRYEVELLRDGRGYSTRQVRGYQHGKPVYVALASFAAGEDGRHVRARTLSAVPRDVTGPGRPADLGGVPAPRPVAADDIDDRRSQGVLVRRPQLRHAPRARPGVPSVEGARAPHQAVWVQAVSTRCARSPG